MHVNLCLAKTKCKSNGGITINVDMSVKNKIYVKKIMFGITLLVSGKIKNV